MTNLNKLFFAIACLLVLAPISSCETTQGTSKDSNNRQSFKQPPIVKEEKKEVNVPPQNQSDNKVEETASALNLPECRKENAPGWWPTPPTNHPDYVFIVGAGLEAKSLVAGKEKAIEDAKKKLYALAGKDGFELPPMNLDFAGDERPDFPCKTSADAKFLNFYKMVFIFLWVLVYH